MLAKYLGQKCVILRVDIFEIGVSNFGKLEENKFKIANSGLTLIEMSLSLSE